MGMRIALGFLGGLVVVPVILATGCGGQTSADRSVLNESQAIAILARELYEDERSFYELHEVQDLAEEVPHRPMWPRTADWTATHVRNGEWRVITNQGTYSVFETGEPSTYLSTIPLAVGYLVSVYLRGGAVVAGASGHDHCYLLTASSSNAGRLYRSALEVARASHTYVGPGAHATVVEIPPECSGEIALVEFGNKETLWIQTRNLALRQ